MKYHNPKITSRVFTILAITVIAIFVIEHEVRGASLYTDTINVGTWASARWSANPSGPFSSGWTANSDVTFFSGYDYTFSGVGSASAVGNILVESNAAVKFTNTSSTLGTDGNVRTFTVETNAVLDFSTQGFSTAAGTGFIKEGSGVLAMAGAGYQGGFTLNGGTMVLRGVNAMGAGAANVLTLSNGILAANASRSFDATKFGGGIFIAGNIQIGALSNNYAANAQYLISDAASITFANDVSLTGAMRTLTIGGNGTYSFNGVISDGGLTVDQASGATGKITLTGDNTYTGGTVINSGATVQLGSGSINGSVVGNITNNGVLVVSPSGGSYSLANLVSGSGSLVKILGTATLSLVADNTYTGSTVISNGVLSLGDGGTTGSVAGDINISVGTLQINRSDIFSMTNVISGNGRLLQAGAGTTIILGNNTHTGIMEVGSGTLQFGNGGTDGTIGGGGINIGSGGTLAINHSDNLTLAQKITNDVNGSFVKLGDGTVTITSDNPENFNGGILISGGALQFGNNSASRIGNNNITNNGVLILNRSSNGTDLYNLVSGTGSLVHASGNLLVLHADNTYTGNTVISGTGILSLGDGGTSGSVAGEINITNASATLRVDRSDTLVLGGEISGDGKFVQYGTGTTILTADNTYTGGTVISNGVLSLGNGGTSGSVVGNITMSNDATLVFNRSDNVTFAGTITNTVSGSLVKLGDGTLTLTADSGSTFKGSVLISEGTLLLGDGSANSGRLGGANNITNNGTLIFNRSGNGNNVTNTISGTGSVVQISGGNLVMHADNTYTGDTIISNGLVALGNGGTTGSVAGKINITNSSAILRIDRSDTLILGNEISGDGRFVQNGDGTTILTANNTYGSTTTISNGVLQIGNGGTSGTVGVGTINIINAASQLVVNRSDAITVTNTISGAGNFEQAGSGVTTLAPNNNSSFSGTTTVSAGTLELKAATGAALNATASVTVNSGATLLLSKSDQVNNAATVTLSGGTIERAGGVSEVFGDLNLTAASFLDYGTGDTGTLTFGTYTPSALLTVDNFFSGNKLVFSSNLTDQMDGNFAFDHDFTTDWNGSTFTITAIPEPSAYVVAVGLIGLMLFWPSRRRLLKNAKSILGLCPPARDRLTKHA